MAPEAAGHDANLLLEERLAALFDALGIGEAHVAARSSTDWEGLAAKYSDRIASLTLACPAAIDPSALRRFGDRLLVVTGDDGPGASSSPAMPG